MSNKPSQEELTEQFKQCIINMDFDTAITQLEEFPEYKDINVEDNKVDAYIVSNFKNYTIDKQKTAAQLLLSLNDSSKDTFLTNQFSFSKSKELLSIKPILKAFIKAGTNIDTFGVGYTYIKGTLRTRMLNAGITAEKLNKWEPELKPEKKTERLFFALNKGVPTDQIKHLLENNINAIDKENGKTPLHHALKKVLHRNDDGTFLTSLLENEGIKSIEVEGIHGEKPFFQHRSTRDRSNDPASNFINYCARNYTLLSDKGNDLLTPLIEHFVTDLILPTRKLSYSNIDSLNKFKGFVETKIDNIQDENITEDFKLAYKSIHKILFEKINEHTPKQKCVSNDFTQAILDGEFEKARALLSKDKKHAKQWIKTDSNIPVQPLWLVASTNYDDKFNEIIDLLVEFNMHLRKGDVLETLSSHDFLKYHGTFIFKEYIIAAGLSEKEKTELTKKLQLRIKDYSELKKDKFWSKNKALNNVYNQSVGHVFDLIESVPYKKAKIALAERQALREAREATKNLAILLTQDEPDLEKAMEIIIKYNKLSANENIKFEGHDQKMSVSRFLTAQFITYEKNIQNNVVDFIKQLNEICSDNHAYKIVDYTIKQLTKNDNASLESYKPLRDLINPPKLTPEASIEESTKEVSENSKSEAESIHDLTVEISLQDEDDISVNVMIEKTPEDLVEDAISDCLARLNKDDLDFDFDTIIDELVRDTMGYAKTVSFDQLTDIVAKIEKTIEDPNDKEWESFRQTIGAIVNKTADHYIEENARVDKTQKLLLLCCLTIIGAIIPLIYYHLKVKPTRAASPLAVYEMSINTFQFATEKKNPDAYERVVDSDDISKEVLNPGIIVHDLWVSSIHRRFTAGNQKHLTTDNDEHTALKRTVLFSAEKDTNANLFNGALAGNRFANNGSEIRWIALRGEQAVRTEKVLEDLDYETVIGAAT